ncbi:MAG: sulfite exporter TauE/SafE family protein, partial [Nitrospirota bacterium]
DVRLAMIILAGSLFGIQLGAIGTTYVKGYTIKLVMGLIMIIVLFSRALMVPVYSSQLGIIPTMGDTAVKILKNTSFTIMILALLVGAIVVLSSMFKGIREERKSTACEPAIERIKV